MRKARERAGFELKRMNRAGRHAVGGVNGLCLNVKASGAKSWVLRVVVGNRRREIGLGGFPSVPLEAARERARAAREQIESGTDPVAAKHGARDALRAADAKRITFDEARDAFLKQKTREFRNAKHAAQWLATLTEYASPVIGRLPVADVDLAHVVRILEPIWATKTETASRVRGRIQAVLAWATVSKYRPPGDNPARWTGNLDQVLAKPSRVRKVEHHAALPWQRIGEFMVKLREREGIAARALEFAILTAARSSEVRLATWDEIDLAARVWTVPEARMKSKKAHRVPLSDAAVKLLKALPGFEGSPYVFPAPRGGAFSDAAFGAVLDRMEVDAVPHGFRSTFKDWARSSTAYPDEVSELALAHVSTDETRAAYARDELLPKRAALMRDWAKFCDKVPRAASVTAIGKRARK